MQAVGLVICLERVRLAAVDGVELGAAHAVGDPSDRLAEEGPVVRHVELLRWEALDDVGAVDLEGLDDGAQGQELDLGGHVFR